MKLEPIFFLLLAAILCLWAILYCRDSSSVSVFIAFLVAIATSAAAAAAYMRETGGAELGSMPSTGRASAGLALRSPDTDPQLDLPPPEHLIVMVNGILGSVNDWKFAADQFNSRFGNKVLVHCSSRNAATLTFDGVDVMGHRLAEEVKEVVDNAPRLRRISFVSHSLGGLIVRYAIGQLYNPFDCTYGLATERHDQNLALDSSSGTILGLQPVNFITIATPHLGSRGNGQEGTHA